MEPALKQLSRRVIKMNEICNVGKPFFTELIRYTTSPRGNVQIIVSDYLYNKERAIGPKTFWRCPLYKVSKQGCRGSLVTSQRNVVIIEGHNHRPDFATISRKDINRVIVLNKV